MEQLALGLVIALVLWIASIVLIRERRRRRLEEIGQLPPGPKCWPVVGNIFQLGWSPHESFTKLAREHGPIMTLWLGSMSTVVISSDEVAREMFKNHDVVLAGRKIYEAMKGDFGNEGSLVTAQYGPHWRMLRRLCTTEFFVARRLEAMRGVRGRCIDHMVHFMEEASASGTKAIDVGRFFFLMGFNLIGNLIFSKDLLDPKSERGAKFFYHAGKVTEYAGKPNLADYFPILRWFDPQGLRRKTQFHVKSAFEIAGVFVKERMEGMECGITEEKRNKDYLDVLLEFHGNGVEEPSSFSSRTINVIVFEMFTTGTDTTTSTLEWAMAELFHNPETLKKVQAELRSTIDPDKKVQENDIENLPYLKAVIKETLRLHPPLPFLVPHMAMDSCKMLGYNIPKETQILVNVWAIGRDPKTWDDPLVFKPERFMEPNMVDYKGHHFEFIPFGSGRRMCPAMPLASRVLPLALGSLLHSFDWVLEDGLKPEEMDMTERMGITLKKAVPLKAIPIPYQLLTRERRHRRLEETGQLPPGPKCWPVVGNIFQLGWSPHESFTKLAREHGPIMTLWLGSMSTVVISSDEVAREMFKNHDVVLAGRKIYEAMKGDYGNEGSLITAQYGPHWRMLRRLCTTEFFVARRLEAMRGVRGRCINHMVHFMEEASASGTKAIDVGRFFFLMGFNLIGNLMFSKDLLDPKSERGAKFFYHAGKVMEYAGKPNLADYLPILRWFDPQGLRRKTQFHVESAFEIAGVFVKERMEGMECGITEEKRNKDYLDVLLEFHGDGVEEPSSFSSRTINVIVFEMFTAGTDTTTSTLEWAMAELFHNPESLKKVQAELRSTIDPDKKLQENDIENLPYLKAVIKETLRLHPPLPFLVPHMAMDSCKMIGYNIPKETQILVNVWAIGRDPKTWDEPLVFKPERFMEPNMVDYKGHHFEFIPFGSGRRICPAMPLASRVLPLALGTLLHSFDWVLADGLKPEEMDMTERMGITLKKAVPLKAIPIPYQ
ncbi:hypothetical protein ACB092_09G052100, partial [Castanea dentata]